MKRSVLSEASEADLAHLRTLPSRGPIFSQPDPVASLAWHQAASTSDPLLKFAINALQDTLPTAATLSSWYGRSPLCGLCHTRQTLPHVLNHCTPALGRYTYRHNLVLRALADCFLSHLPPNSSMLCDLPNWPSAAAPRPYVFPYGVATPLRPDILIWRGPEIWLVELTCPWEANFYQAHSRKLSKYQPLEAQLLEHNHLGANLNLIPRILTIEVGSRGVVSMDSLTAATQSLGLDLPTATLRSLTAELALASLQGSYWIFLNKDRPGPPPQA